MSLFDRFLSTNTKSASNALASKFNFQLAAITAYYISINTTEAGELDAQLLCYGRYEKSMILSMEQDILEAIEWRTSSPTHLDFMRQVLLLFDFDVYMDIVENAEMNAANVIRDSYFSTVAPSVVAAACVAKAFRDSNIQSTPELNAVWNEVFQALELNRSTELMSVQLRLKRISSHVRQTAPCFRAVQRKSKRYSYISLEDSSSPVSVDSSM
jgi:hypothetical protein